MFCTFLFAVLLLKYCLLTGDQLQRYCTSDISYSSQVAYNGVTEQSKRHLSGMMSPLAGIADNTERNFFYIHEMAI